jgi:hypothetical protein
MIDASSNPNGVVHILGYPKYRVAACDGCRYSKSRSINPYVSGQKESL